MDHEESLWSEYVRNGEAFASENFVLGAGGTFAHVQLFNPVGSGKKVRLRTFNMILAVSVAGNVTRHDTPLTTLGVPAGFILENLLAGGPPPVAEMRSQSPVVPLGTLFWQVNAPANTPATYPAGGREWGYDLLEGHGINVYGASGATLIINWMWAEVPL